MSIGNWQSRPLLLDETPTTPTATKRTIEPLVDKKSPDERGFFYRLNNLLGVLHHVIEQLAGAVELGFHGAEGGFELGGDFFVAQLIEVA